MIPQFPSQGELREVEAQLAAEPDSVPLLMRRALILDSLGKTREARDAYIEVVKREPSHLEALNSLGTLLFNTGFRSAARLTYTEAIKWHPGVAMLHVNLGNALLDAGRRPEARAHYEEALRLDPSNPGAHQGLSYVLERLGHLEDALRHRALGFAEYPMAISRYRGEGVPITVLMLLCARGGNIATDLILDDRTFMLVKLFTEYYDRELPLPPHDVIFNAIGDVELSEPDLLAARELEMKSQAPIINPAQIVLRTSRSEVTERLASIAGVIAPRTRRVGRASLAPDQAPKTIAECGLRYPLLVRSPGFHTGEHFELIESADQLPGALAKLPGDQLLLIEYLDARDTDGKARKYRVMMIDGGLYPLHLAFSNHWKVHYFTADLMEQTAYREQEERFLNDMPGVLGVGAMTALEAIARELGLAYAGVDFGLDGNGNVLLFEANATMKIVPPGNAPEFAYRLPAIDRALAAARAMVIARSRLHPAS